MKLDISDVLLIIGIILVSVSIAWHWIWLVPAWIGTWLIAAAIMKGWMDAHGGDAPSP